MQKLLKTSVLVYLWEVTAFADYEDGLTAVCAILNIDVDMI